MRVFHLTTEFPWPAISGGPLRTLSQLRLIASLPEVEHVTLLSVTERGVSESDLQALSSAVEKLRVIPPPFHPIHLFDHKRYLPRVVSLRLFGVPYLAGKWDSRSLRLLVRRELAGNQFNTAFFDHLGMARYLPEIAPYRPGCRIVLDQHNVESEFFRQYAAERTGPLAPIVRAEFRAARRFEVRALRAADTVVAISREDAECIQRVSGVSASVVPLFVPFQRLPRPHPETPHFCYLGNLRWRPNARGLDWFCGKVWPLVRHRLPDATFEIAGVGLKPDAAGRLPVPPAWQVPGVRTVGFLEDLEPLYRRSLAMLAPTVGGSGVRMKLLEGFRAGLPVVTTSDGAKGLSVVDGEQVLIADDPQGFAEQMTRIADGHSLRDHIREGAYAFLEQNHSLAVSQSAMRRVLGLDVP